MGETTSSVEHVDFLGVVEHDLMGVAVATEQVANPLLLAGIQLVFAVPIAVERSRAAQIGGHVGAHGSDVLGQHLIKYMAEADGHAHLLYGVEVGALPLVQDGGQDAGVSVGGGRGLQAGLVAQALCLAFALLDVAQFPVERHLLEVEILVHKFYSHFGSCVQI